MKFCWCLFVLLFFSNIVLAEETHKVGKAAAARYFQNEKLNEKRNLASEEKVNLKKDSKSHYMSLGFGTFSSATGFNWAQSGREDKIGKWGIDLTYRFEEQEYLFDQLLKISYNEYKPVEEESNKLSFLYALIMPEADSQFPLYFGAAAGLGIYTKQISPESLLSLDYQLYLGLRAFNVFDSVGFYVEGGLRNHLHILSDGQFNGTFLSLGSVFTF